MALPAQTPLKSEVPLKTMQPMKDMSIRPPYERLELDSRGGSRLAPTQD
jgi:hypothetical protein